VAIGALFVALFTALLTTLLSAAIVLIVLILLALLATLLLLLSGLLTRFLLILLTGLSLIAIFVVGHCAFPCEVSFPARIQPTDACVVPLKYVFAAAR
jgi:hypothetical protein